MSFLASTAETYLRYSDGLEEIDPKETQTFEEINQLMSKGADTVKEKYHRPLRISHAKAHGTVRGKLIVNSDLPDYLRQGLFATPGKQYDVIIRLAHTPGELFDDRKVSTPRGFSIKVLNVEGEQLNMPGSASGSTQDFVFDTGKAFIAPNASAFHQAFKPNAEMAPHLSDTTKGVVSSISRGTNKVLNAIGMDSGKLDFFGHPFLHPLAEYYYSQVPSRYGDYVAKFSVEPNTPGLQELKDKEFEPLDENGLRTDVVEYLRTHDAEYTFGVQLATDRDTMPIEDATAVWPENVSPYQPVARIVIPAQDAYSAGKAEYVEKLSFSPAHTLVAHRPMGSLNRARLHAYSALAAKRRSELSAREAEPASVADFPA